MIRKKTCKQCGKSFIAYSPRQRFCSESCRKTSSHKKNKNVSQLSKQLCWSCAKCTGGCSWSKEFKPIEGWTAAHIYRRDGGRDVETYDIFACPEFVRG